MKPYSFVKLNKAIINDDIFKNEKALKVYIWLLCKATYKESDIFVGNTPVHLDKGDVVVGVKSLCEELGISYQNLRSILLTLKLTSKITTKATSRFTVISILDKEVFAWNGNFANDQTNEQSNDQTNHNKEYIENKNNRRYYTRTPKKIKYAYAGYDLDLYEKMLNEQD